MEYIVESDKCGARLDVVVSTAMDWTRSFSQKSIELGMVKVNSLIQTKASYKLKEKDVVDIVDINAEETKVVGEKIHVDIIYEDDDIIIVNKPRGMVVHPGNGNHEGTLVNALIYSHKDKLSQINGIIRPGIVHRIDKDTSGILVVAKNDNAHKRLSEQFKVHSINREYVALVSGIVEKDRIKINLPIGRDPLNRLKMGVVSKNSKPAITNVTVLKRLYNSNCTLIQAVLETGRTHQIRVHMTYIGHPLVCDKLYGGNTKICNMEGQILHARKLGFIHPTTNKYVEYVENLPPYFTDLLKTLEEKEGRN